MRTCVIVGQNYPDAALEAIVAEYGRVIIFEPLPEAAKACQSRFWNNPGVIVFEAACGEVFWNSSFYVYNIQGLSSSLGEITEDAVNLFSEHYDLSLKGTISVQVLHLGFMLQMLGVSTIHFLLIDAQGMDFTILKTIEPWVEDSHIRLIQLEAEGKGFRHYDGLPDNSEESILRWMERFPQYEVSRIEGRLAEQPDLVFELKSPFSIDNESVNP